MSGPVPVREHPILRDAPLAGLIAGPWTGAVTDHAFDKNVALALADLWLVVLSCLVVFAIASNLAAVRYARTAKLRGRAKLALGWLTFWIMASIALELAA
jgi:hypothetical protein